MIAMAGMAVAAPAGAAQADAAPGAAVVAASGSAVDTAEPPVRYPPEAFAEIPLVLGPMLSPDGKRVLFRSELDGKTRVVVQALDKSSGRSFSFPDGIEFNWYRWAGDDRVLISISSVVWTPFPLRRSSLRVYDVRDGSIRDLGAEAAGLTSLEGDDVLYIDPAGRHLLLSIQEDLFAQPGVYRVNLDDGSFVRVQEPHRQVDEWFADSTGVVRVGMSFRRNEWSLYYRRAEGEALREMAEIDYLAKETEQLLSALQLIGGSDRGFTLAVGEDGRKALYRYDFATRAIGELVYANPEYDIDDYLIDGEGNLLAVMFTDDRERVLWFDKTRADWQSKIEAATKAEQVVIEPGWRNGPAQLVRVANAGHPGAHYVLDTAANALSMLSIDNETLDPAQLAQTRYVEYRARDGLLLHAYLTLPRGREPSGLPLVILPHGGPFGVRDSLYFDPEVQFLANRGYAVLQPNYRGSGGYGEVLFEAGVGEVGRRMQDDLDDGMDWLAGQGIADPARVCVVGASYGGYAALWAVTRNPERYRCAASFAGVTDWDRMLRYDGRFLNRRAGKRWKGRIQGDRKFDLDDVSPLRRVANLSRPVLIAQGGEDTNVPKEQAEIYVKALKKARRPHEYLFYEKEGHGFSDPKNLADWLTNLEAFLAKHNPA